MNNSNVESLRNFLEHERTIESSVNDVYTPRLSHIYAALRGLADLEADNERLRALSVRPLKWQEQATQIAAYEQALVIERGKAHNLTQDNFYLRAERDQARRDFSECTTSLIAADRQIERLRAELADVLGVTISRTGGLGYDDDDDYKARYRELTGKEWDDDDAPMQAHGEGGE